MKYFVISSAVVCAAFAISLQASPTTINVIAGSSKPIAPVPADKTKKEKRTYKSFPEFLKDQPEFKKKPLTKVEKELAATIDQLRLRLDDETQLKATLNFSESSVTDRISKHLPAYIAYVKKELAKPKIADLGEITDKLAKMKQVKILLKTASKKKLSQKEIDTLELELAKFGKIALTELKLASLSSDFEKRTLYNKLYSRIRWRLVADKKLLEKVPDLISIMASSDAKKRSAALDTIILLSAVEAIPFYIECLADEQIYIKERAIDGIIMPLSGYSSSRSQNAKIYKKLGLAALTNLVKHGDPETKLRAISALQKLDAIDIELFSGLLSDPSEEVRSTVIMALGRSQKASAAPHILPLLDDDSWRIRKACLEALGKLRMSKVPRSIGDKVVKRLNDPDPYIKQIAAKVLSGWSYKPAVTVILKMMKNKEIPTLEGYATLSLFASPVARDQMIQLYKTTAKVSDKISLINSLNNYDEDKTVDNFFTYLLKDRKIIEAYPEVLNKIIRRRNWRNNRVAIILLMFDLNEKVALGAYNAISYRTDEFLIEDEYYKKLLASDKIDKKFWALQSKLNFYRYDKPEAQQAAVGAIRDGFAQNIPSINNEMLACLYRVWVSQNQSLNMVAPRGLYRELYFYSFDLGSRKTNLLFSESFKKEMTPFLKKIIAGNSATPKLLACGIFYRQNSNDKKINSIISKALKLPHNFPRFAYALNIIKDNPKPFAKQLNITKLANNPDFSNITLDIIAGLNDPKYNPLIYKIAGKDFIKNRNQSILKMLLKLGTPKAMKLIEKAYEKADSYDLRSTAQSLYGSNTPNADRFAIFALNHPATKKNDYYASNLIEMILDSENEQAYKYLEANSEKLTKNSKLYSRTTGFRILAKLYNKYPQKYQSKFDGFFVLESSNISISSPLPARVIKRLWELKKLHPHATSIDFSSIIRTHMTTDEIIAHAVPLFDSLDKTSQCETLRKLLLDYNKAIADSSKAQSKKKILSLLQSFKPKKNVYNDFISFFLSSVYQKNKKLIPAKKDFGKINLCTHLLAISVNKGSYKLIAQYMQDSRNDVKIAACKAMSYQILAYPDQKYPASIKQPLVSAITFKNPPASYLASEAVGTLWPDELQKFKASDIRYSATLARIVLAQNKKLSPAMKAKFETKLSTSSSVTMHQLALIGLLNSRNTFTPPTHWFSTLEYSTSIVSPDNSDIKFSPFIADIANTALDNLWNLTHEKKYATSHLHRFLIAPDNSERYQTAFRYNQNQSYLSSTYDGTYCKPSLWDYSLNQLVIEKSYPNLNDSNALKYLGDATKDRHYTLLETIPGLVTEDEDFFDEIYKSLVKQRQSRRIYSDIELEPIRAILLAAVATVPDEKLADLAKTMTGDSRKGIINAAILTIKNNNKDARKILLETATKRWTSPIALEPALALIALRETADPADLAKMKKYASEMVPTRLSRYGHFMVLMNYIHFLSPLSAAEIIAQIEVNRSEYISSYTNRTNYYKDSLQTLIAADYESFQKLKGKRLRKLQAAISDSTNEYNQAYPNRALSILYLLLKGNSSNPNAKSEPELYNQILQSIFYTPDELTVTPKREIDNYFGVNSNTARKTESARSTSSIFSEQSEKDLAFSAEFFGPLSRHFIDRYHAGTHPFSQARHYYTEKQLIDKIRPLINSKDWNSQELGIRLATMANLDQFTGDIRRVLQNSTNTTVIENAAWALVLRHGDTYISDIRKRFQNSSDPARKIRLAVVLYKLGDKPAKEFLIKKLRKQNMMRVRKMFHKTVSKYLKNDYYASRLERVGKNSYTPLSRMPESILPDLDYTPENRALNAYHKLLMPLIEEFVQQQYRVDLHLDDIYSKEIKFRKPSLDNLALGLNVFIGAEASLNQMPVANLNIFSDNLQYGMLIDYEENLEPVFFVQFAADAKSPAHLLKLWQKWWDENKNKTRDDWKKQALKQAIAELTHPKWYIRVRAYRRLHRLTGAAYDKKLPGPLDLNTFKSLQRKWKKSAVKLAKQDPKAWIIDSAISQKIISTSDRNIYKDSKKYLELLVKLAREKSPIGESAMIELNSWPNRKELLLAATDLYNNPGHKMISQWYAYSLMPWYRNNLPIYLDRDQLRDQLEGRKAQPVKSGQFKTGRISDTPKAGKTQAPDRPVTEGQAPSDRPASTTKMSDLLK